MGKEYRYQDNIRRSLREQWLHIEKMMQQLPDSTHLDWDTLSDTHKGLVEAVKAIEEEWILDDEIRAEMTVLEIDEEM